MIGTKAWRGAGLVPSALLQARPLQLCPRCIFAQTFAAHASLQKSQRRRGPPQSFKAKPRAYGPRSRGAHVRQPLQERDGEFSNRSRTTRPRDRPDELAQDDLPESVLRFAEAIEARDAAGAIACCDQAFEHLPGAKLVSSYLILLARAAAQCKDDEQAAAHIAEAASRVRINSVQSGVPPSDSVYKRLFAIYRELSMWQEGKSLWRWLTRQDEQILYLSTYAAAIEFFSHAHKLSQNSNDYTGGFKEMANNIYNDALASNVGAFLQYQLSPNAILQDAESRNSQSLPADCEVLLEKYIATQSPRVLHSLMLLDTALRVFGRPTERTVTTMLQDQDMLSLEQKYIVLRLALRAGVCPKPSTMQTYLYDLTRAPGRNRPVLAEYIVSKTEELTAAMKLVLCWYSASGTFDERLVASALLPVQDAVERLAILSYTSAAHELTDAAEQLVDAVYPLLTPPAPALHNALLSIGSYANHPELLKRNLDKLLARDGEPNRTTCRAVVVGAGSAGLSTLQEAWRELEAIAESQRKSVERLDMDALVFAVSSLRDAEAVAFLEAQSEKHRLVIHSGVFRKLRREAKTAASPAPMLLHEEQEAIDKMCAALEATRGILQTIVASPEFVLDHTALGMSITSPMPRNPAVSSITALRPSGMLASLSDYYEAYKLLCVEASPASEMPAFEQLDAFPVLKQRLLDWCEMTNLLVMQQCGPPAIVYADEETGLVADGETADAVAEALERRVETLVARLEAGGASEAEGQTTLSLLVDVIALVRNIKSIQSL